MNRRNKILIVTILLFALPLLSVVMSNTQTLNTEKCSAEIEGLKLCVNSSEIAVNSGEPVFIQLLWVNSSDEERDINGPTMFGYPVIIKNEKGEKLLSVYQQRQIERDKRLENPKEEWTAEDSKEIERRLRGGSNRGFSVEAKQSRTIRIPLTDINYDYDLTSKGKYTVTISKTVPSLEKKKAIKFVIEDIEIEVF